MSGGGDLKRLTAVDAGFKSEQYHAHKAEIGLQRCDGLAKTMHLRNLQLSSEAIFLMSGKLSLSLWLSMDVRQVDIKAHHKHPLLADRVHIAFPTGWHLAGDVGGCLTRASSRAEATDGSTAGGGAGDALV